MNEARKQAMLSAARTMLVFVGTLLVTKGYFTEAVLNEVIGAVMVLAPLVWGIWDKFSSEKKTEAREHIAVNVGIKVADLTVGPTPAVAPASVASVIANVAPLVTLPGEKL